MPADYQLSSRFPYVKHKGFEKDQRAPQRVIIPKGIVDPNQTTIIEIPTGMENMPTIVAQKSQGNRGSSPSRRQYLQNSPQERTPQYSKNGPQEPSQYLKSLNHALQEKLNNKRLNEPATQDKSLPKLGRPHQKYLHETGVAKEERSYDTEPKYYTRSYPTESGRQGESDYYSAKYDDQDLLGRRSPYGTDQRKSRSMKGYLHIPSEYRTKINYRSQSPTSRSPPTEVNKGLRIRRVLDRLDEIELQGLEEDLKNFQTARRKLIFDVSSMKMF